VEIAFVDSGGGGCDIVGVLMMMIDDFSTFLIELFFWGFTTSKYIVYNLKSSF